MSSIREAVTELRRRGLAVVPIRPGDKRPQSAGWTLASKEADDFAEADNVGILTGRLSSDLVCLDLDGAEALAHADEYLPATAMIDGRPGKQRSHRYYRVRNVPPDMISTAAGGIGGPRTRRFGAAKIDFQGTGSHVVCPPSLHASGERRGWETWPADPAEVDCGELLEAVKRLATECGWIDRSDEARRYVSRIKAESGKGGHNATFRVASALVNGFAIEPDEALPVFRDWNKTNAVPPWSESELDHKMAGAIDAAGTDPRYPPGHLIREGRTFNDPVLLAARFPGLWVCWHGSFYQYDGGRYALTGDGELRARIHQHIDKEFGKEYARQLRAYADPLTKAPIPSRPQVRKHMVAEVVAALQARTTIADGFEMPCVLPSGQSRPWLAFSNGILDSETLALSPHTQDWFSTVKLSYPYDPAATEPRLEDRLETWFGEDAERKAIAQEWAGYLLTSSTGAQTFAMLVGDGANGKGGFAAMIQALLGRENYSSLAWSTLGERFGLAETLGKLLNYSDEVGEFDRTTEGLLKWFVAGQPLTFERKFKDAFSAVPTARLMLSCNKPPVITDKSDGVWRRMLLLPFDRKVPADKRVENMDKAVWWERNANMSGILNWALAGLQRFRASGGRFTVAAACESAKRTMRAEANPASVFLRENVAADTGGKDIASAALYTRYREWAVQNGNQPLNAINFAVEVHRMFGVRTQPRKIKGQSAKVWIGLRWTDGIRQWKIVYAELREDGSPWGFLQLFDGDGKDLTPDAADLQELPNVRAVLTRVVGCVVDGGDPELDVTPYLPDGWGVGRSCDYSTTHTTHENKR